MNYDSVYRAAPSFAGSTKYCNETVNGRGYIIHQASLDPVKVSAKPKFLTKTQFFFVVNMPANLKTFQGIYEFKKIYILLKVSRIWLKLNFNSPKDLVPELTGKRFWPRLHFSWKRLMHRLRSNFIFPKMSRLKFQFEN